ncbi:hypothetical protein ACPYO6_15590 [Georgenia sp. Z1344]|uniref:hypothetical protein n=1 Tax=Georgenia sp. Z1344 TaxID=3416706 RepID=UPI003CEEAEFA
MRQPNRSVRRPVATGAGTQPRPAARRHAPGRARRTLAATVLALAATLAACGSGDDSDGSDGSSDSGNGSGGSGDTSEATPVDELAPVADQVDEHPAWLSEETSEPRDSASGLCTDPFAEGRTELTTTELAACQVESLAETAGYVQTTDAGADARTELRVSTGEQLAVEADLGVAHVLVVGDDWWAATDEGDWLEPAEAAEIPRLSSAEGAARSLQQLHDPSVAAGGTQPIDVAVTGSATIDGTEVAVVTGTGEGANGEEIAVEYFLTQDYVALRSVNNVTTSAGTATTTSVISELDEPQDVTAP